MDSIIRKKERKEKYLAKTREFESNVPLHERKDLDLYLDLKHGMPKLYRKLYEETKKIKKVPDNVFPQEILGVISSFISGMPASMTVDLQLLMLEYNHILEETNDSESIRSEIIKLREPDINCSNIELVINEISNPKCSREVAIYCLLCNEWVL